LIIFHNELRTFKCDPRFECVVHPRSEGVNVDTSKQTKVTQNRKEAETNRPLALRLAKVSIDAMHFLLLGLMMDLEPSLRISAKHHLSRRLRISVLLPFRSSR
jgi:hypothetical protein